MCGRFTLYAKGEILAAEFGVPAPGEASPRYNIAPSQDVAAVRASPVGGAREMARLRWGLVPSWAKDPAIGNRLINARSETVREKPSFRNAFRRRRCLIPASGFYEWRRNERGKQPCYGRRRAGRGFAFAGVGARWESPEGGVIESCAILTTGANAVLAPIHDRMPVILERAQYERWLDPSLPDTDSLAPLLSPFPPEGMTAWPVSPRVNAPSNDDEECVAPLI
jgi:putative SOS response-associated peptidase YedK